MPDALAAFFRQLKREYFLDDEYRNCAGFDRPLPIGFGQTISQPTLVLRMTEELALDKAHKVLEIGTGSGYQTAFLAEFAGMVYTVERIGSLSEKAQGRLKALGYENVRYKIGDGSAGWAEHAPYDRIIVTAAAAKVPEALMRQLAAPGRMLIPVGQRALQELAVLTKDKSGNVTKECVCMVRFVEMVGEYGWD